jgi:hypothetical protein
MPATGSYAFNSSLLKENTNFAHTIPIDKNSLIIFDRNDKRLHPLISRKLKLQGVYWKLYNKKELTESLNNLKAQESETEINYLNDIVNQSLKDVAINIQKNNSGKKLEEFTALLFETMYKDYSIDVKNTGSGWKSDYGADLMMSYTVNPVGEIDIRVDISFVVQVKSYTGTINSVQAIEDCKNAINKFKAKNFNYAVIVTTAIDTGEEFKKYLEKYNNDEEVRAKNNQEKGVPIFLINGLELAKLYLKYMV